MNYAILSIAVAIAISGAFIGGIFVGRDMIPKADKKVTTESDDGSYKVYYSVYEPVDQYELGNSAD